MREGDSEPPPSQSSVALAVEARRLLRRARKAALATIDHSSRYPYASLAAVATEPDGAPVLLLSRLAAHTRNLDDDSRASLLIEGPGAHGDPLSGGRVSLVGRVRPTGSQTAERRFLAVHPSAAGYARFADFSFYVLDLEWAQYVGGFGRISTLSRSDVLLDVGGAEELVAAEPELVELINREHADGLARLGAKLSGGRSGRWRLTGIDPGGCDLALADERHRCDFVEHLSSFDGARRAMELLLAQS